LALHTVGRCHKRIVMTVNGQIDALQRLSEKGTAPLVSDRRTRTYVANHGVLFPFRTALQRYADRSYGPPTAQYWTGETRGKLGSFCRNALLGMPASANDGPQDRPRPASLRR
jgi:hypothetical protein